MNQFGGTISVHSVPRKGSTFKFTFNIEESRYQNEQQGEVTAFEANSKKLYFDDPEEVVYQINHRQFKLGGKSLGGQDI